MAKSARPSPSLLPAVMALAVLLVFGYFLFTDSKPSRTEHTLSPPINIVDPELETVPADDTEFTIEQQKLMQEEAELFIEKLTSSDKTAPVTLTEESGEFVRHDGYIKLPDLEKRTTTIKALANDITLNADTPITLDFTETERKATTLAELALTTEDKTQLFTIETEQGEIIEAPLAVLLSKPELDPQAHIIQIIQHKRHEEITKAELTDLPLSPSQQVEATINHGVQEFSVKEIIPSDALPDNALFYLHRVTEQDRQGLWGIIQSGLIERFREGLVLEGLSINKDKVQVTIPADADEPLPTGLSSFLGKVLNEKVASSYVYNFNTHTMGHDPNLIFPGQQLILIHFSEQELKTIYSFFAKQRQEQAQSFAIPD